MAENDKAPDPAPEETPPPAPAASFDFSEKIQELWQGRLPLLQVFWLYFFSVLFVMKVLGDTLGFLAGLFGLLQLVWAGFMIKPIFIAADNYQGDQHWAVAAKVAALVLAVVLFFDAVMKLV